jgi:integrase
MAGPDPRGSVFRTRSGGYGIRWPEAGRRPQRTGFRTKTEARSWFDERVKPRLRAGTPDPAITFDAFCDLFLERHGATVADSTRAVLEERLAAARARFGTWTLAELQDAAADVAAWRAGLTDSSRYRLTSAMRQTLAAAVRWRYIARNPAVEAGRNPQPRAEELRPFTRDEIDALVLELGPTYGPLVVVAAETGLRTNEWVGLERRDIDNAGRALTVQRRFSDGILSGYPKTERSRRRVPLTGRELDALAQLPPRLDTQLVFPADQGGHIGLDTWRTRESYPALDAANITRRGPYCLRHTFATEALAAGVSIFELARLMGTFCRDDRPHLRPPCDRRRGHDPRPARGESRTTWRQPGVRRRRRVGRVSRKPP